MHVNKLHIHAYLTGVYSTFRGSKYILNDRGSKFTSKQFTWLAKELGFIKVYISPYTPTGSNSMDTCFSEGIPEKTSL